MSYGENGGVVGAHGCAARWKACSVRGGRASRAAGRSIAFTSDTQRADRPSVLESRRKRSFVQVCSAKAVHGAERRRIRLSMDRNIGWNVGNSFCTSNKLCCHQQNYEPRN